MPPTHVVEKRRGELLGDDGPGRPKKNSQRAENTPKIPEGTKSNYRALARWWEPLLWPTWPRFRLTGCMH